MGGGGGGGCPTPLKSFVVDQFELDIPQMLHEQRQSKCLYCLKAIEIFCIFKIATIMFLFTQIYSNFVQVMNPSRPDQNFENIFQVNTLCRSIVLEQYNNNKTLGVVKLNTLILNSFSYIFCLNSFSHSPA